MNKAFIIVSDSGDIKGWVYAPTGEYPVREGEHLIPHDNVDFTEMYFDFDSFSCKDKQDFELNNLPLPCTVTIEGVSYEVTEQPTFQFDVPGVYQIHVDAGPQYYKKVFDYDYQP